MIAAAAITGLLIGNTALAGSNESADNSNTDQHKAKTKSMDNHSCNGCPNGCPSHRDTKSQDSPSGDSKHENDGTSSKATNPEEKSN